MTWVDAIVMAVVGYGATFMLQDAKIFDGIRDRLRGGAGSKSFIDRMLDCSYCTGIWVGLFLGVGELGLILLAELGAEFWATAIRRLFAWPFCVAVVAVVADPLMARLELYGVETKDRLDELEQRRDDERASARTSGED